MPLHISIPIENTMEPIEYTKISPLITKCNVKVCYVGQEPNRNGTVITKEVATEMGRNLPGSPVVGFFNQDDQDFEGHERELIVKNGKYEFIDITKPYGFVPTDADVWFQKFNDEGQEREYLVTECYLWTKAYPESQRIIEQGNNQSMELTENSTGFWTEYEKSNGRIFIYTDALIEKLCILGENVEPCFEGAQITSYSIDTNTQEFKEFKETLYSMISDLQKTIGEGGFQMPDNTQDFACGGGSSASEDSKKKKFEDSGEDKKKKEQDTTPQKKEEDTSKEEDKKKKDKEYSLEEINELIANYNTLNSQYEALKNEKDTLEKEIEDLRDFKLKADRKEKKAMIDSFYMLNDSDKSDVISNIDTYSLDEIEAKLSVICVHNKVNFNEVEVEKNTDNMQGLFSLNAASTSNVPDWIAAVQNFQNR